MHFRLRHFCNICINEFALSRYKFFISCLVKNITCCLSNTKTLFPNLFNAYNRNDNNINIEEFVMDERKINDKKSAYPSRLFSGQIHL